MAAALAALDVLEADDGAVYLGLEARGTRLMQGLGEIAKKHKVAAKVQGLPAIFQVFFTDGAPPRNYREAVACDRDKALAFHMALQDEGIRTNQNAKFFLSVAHDDAIIDETLAAADRAMAVIA
jgi:glutamate-1-semialdehyde 2,1-aminomutase